MSAIDALYPAPRAVAIGIIALAFGLSAFGVLRAGARMDLSAMEQRACRAELAALRARNPFVDRYLLPSEPCLALEVLSAPRSARRSEP